MCYFTLGFHFLQVWAETDNRNRRYGCLNSSKYTAHIDHIRYSILTPLISQLRATGQKVSVIIATDGLPTDQDGYCNKHTKDQFIASLRSLEGLPVWIVIRLCTDEDEIVDFYKEIDRQLELSVEVLSDYICEAEDVYEHNKWLNYGTSMRRSTTFVSRVLLFFSIAHYARCLLFLPRFAAASLSRTGF